jgi:hypothetical protein
VHLQSGPGVVVVGSLVVEVVVLAAAGQIHGLPVVVVLVGSEVVVVVVLVVVVELHPSLSRVHSCWTSSHSQRQRPSQTGIGVVVVVDVVGAVPEAGQGLSISTPRSCSPVAVGAWIN